jgi:L-ascorbate metabolism protein UlaG (beta-lactamase superfamily)
MFTFILNNQLNSADSKCIFTGLSGDYSGQTPHGETPKVFASGIISSDFKEHFAPAVSPNGNEVHVTYVGNAGFLINIGDKKILIDALFKGFEGNYIIPRHIQEKLKLAQAPFDKVDLILVTHAHGDHFNVNMVSEHMKNNPKAIFASTQQSVKRLNGFSDRSIIFNPSKKKSDKKEVQGFSIETFFLPHGPNSKIINIGFLVSVNGVTFFQTGDADFEQFTFDEFRSLQLPERKIDLLFIQHYYLRGDSLNAKFVKEAIGGKYIIPIHYHFTTPSFDSAIILQNYPEAIIFKEELQSWSMPDKKDKSHNLKGD